jgi:hypothetical protein
MATFSDAHYADRIQLGGRTVVVLTEPAACSGGCGLRCCTALNETGARVPLHAAPSAPITVLATPGGRR